MTSSRRRIHRRPFWPRPTPIGQDISEGLAEAYLRFKRAGVPAELHIYSTGGHGFGLRASNKRPVGHWMVRFDEWLKESGFVK